MATGMQGWKRTGRCGEVGAPMVSRQVTLMGWVQRARNLGGLIFVWLRDRTGIVQVVFDADVCGAECFALGESMRSEFVVAVRGEVARRALDAVNAKLATGEVEVFVKEAIILNRAETPPIYIEDDANENELVRLKYRYLDLRRPRMQRTLMLRHHVLTAIRAYMDSQGFWDVETPILTKSTPEGARDFLVPSRLHAGEFYALPQSPQIYKQLLMLAGVDRYYQVARCFRDEDSRADRQPEFTQVDIEMSFIEPPDIQEVVEGAFKAAFRRALDMEIQLPLPRITWQYAMENYGSDKPDRRFDMLLKNVSALCAGCGFSVFENAVAAGGSVRGINASGLAPRFTRKEIDSLVDYVKTYRAKGLAYILTDAEGGVKSSSFAKNLSAESLSALLAALGAGANDALFFVADKDSVVFAALGALRQEIARRCELIDKSRYDLFWVTEFPLLERDEETGGFSAMHHPFTSCMDEDIDLLETDPARVRAKAYDLVLNGVEMGSGSIRIHDSATQQRMFERIGLSAEEAKKRFGFMLEAFKYGTPPHGGFAFGVDRMVMMMSGAGSLRDVIAFPKAQGANCLMMETPSDVSPDQLKMLSIAIDRES